MRRRLHRHRSWRSHECGNDRCAGCRQKEPLARGRWRRQHSEFARPRRQEENGQRRRRFIVRAPEDHDRPVDENQFSRRRRRNTEVVEREIGLRLDGRAKHGQPALRIPDVRSPRVSAQI